MMVKGQYGDFSIWMSRLPGVIVFAIIVPLVISIAHIILYTSNHLKNKSSENEK
jgi:hypothetical protein